MNEQELALHVKVQAARWSARAAQRALNEAEREQQQQATTFIRERLAAGPVAHTELVKALRARGYTFKMFEVAVRALNIAKHVIPDPANPRKRIGLFMLPEHARHWRPPARPRKAINWTAFKPNVGKVDADLVDLLEACPRKVL